MCFLSSTYQKAHLSVQKCRRSTAAVVGCAFQRGGDLSTFNPSPALSSPNPPFCETHIPRPSHALLARLLRPPLRAPTCTASITATTPCSRRTLKEESSRSRSSRLRTTGCVGSSFRIFSVCFPTAPISSECYFLLRTPYYFLLNSTASPSFSMHLLPAVQTVVSARS